jgi:hypothetical protein
MGAGVGLSAPEPAPELAAGWRRLADAVALDLPPAEIDGVWTFPVVRHDRREWGTAILARIDGDRRRIYTARYALAIKGKERGRFEATIEEVGAGPVEALAELRQEVHKRTDDEGPPVPADLERWFPPAIDGTAQPG